MSDTDSISDWRRCGALHQMEKEIRRCFSPISLSFSLEEMLYFHVPR